MEFKLLSEDKNLIKIEVVDPDETLLNPLVSELLRNSEVAEARYQMGHPQFDKPVLIIRTRKTKPQTALKKAAEDLAEQFREAKKLFEKELK